MRERTAWLAVLPLLVAGELAGHSLAYRIVAPGGAERAALLARTGHDYLSYLHPLPALCAVLLSVALARRVADGFSGAALRRVPSWWLALLPAGAFLLQEYLERLAHAG